MKQRNFDERRDIVVPGNHQETIRFAAENFLSLGSTAISEHGYFAVALSGGSTPQTIYELLTTSPCRSQIDWSCVLLFWSDERAVPKNHSDSNYRMAMESFSKLPLKKENIFPMETDGNLDENAQQYEQLIFEKIPSNKFDLVMLGMGDDGHTASLFPKTHGLHPVSRLVTANYVPQKETWRLTLTFECINQADHTAIYVLGKSKTEMVKKVLEGPYNPDEYPVQRVGTPQHPALWILDAEAASLL